MCPALLADYYQLRRFVGDVKALEAAAAGEPPPAGAGAGALRSETEVVASMAADAASAAANMALVDAVYAAAGLAPREASEAWW